MHTGAVSENSDPAYLDESSGRCLSTSIGRVNEGRRRVEVLFGLLVGKAVGGYVISICNIELWDEPTIINACTEVSM